ncbi:MAG: DNA polymerase III subunit alpha [Planctomycetes bacterium]|nr:DNA polymerase III subunit alpha [Planctomycetota bacterium]
MKKSDFVHLHLHSQYSLLDGFATFENIFQITKRLQMNAVALTDHGNLFGAVEFYQNALKNGIKPIVGCEMYVAPGKMTEKTHSNNEELYYHLTLLVKDETGYKNLLKLSSIAYQQGFYYKPRIDKEVLANHCSGLIVLSGCMSSEISYHLNHRKPEKAFEVASFYKDLLGEDFYIELQNHGIKEQEEIIKGQVKISKELNIPVAATNDVHYLARDDSKVHDVLLCIATNKLVTDSNRLKMSTDEFYYKTPDEMKAIFSEIPDAIKNTVRISDACNLEMRFGDYHLPKFKPPEGKSSAAYLRALCETGLNMRYGTPTDVARKRLEYELGVIEKMGFADYFLIVWDFIRYARQNNISVGPGRGSSAGSLLAYTLEITDIDPLKYDLLFERFMNPGRRELPDIDVDFNQEGREQVINYVRQKYGNDSVAQIITFGTMKARAAVRDVGRVLGMPLFEVDRLAKRIPDTLGITLREALDSDKELKSLYQNKKETKELFDISMKLEGLCRHASTHAAGVVIADKVLTEYTPLYNNSGVITTQYDMDQLQKIGLLKVDMLALATLPVIDNCVKIVEKNRNIKIDIQKIPLNDKDTYRLLSSGDTKGVFQLESAGMRDLEQKLKPDIFEDIIALIALYRPGPLKSRMVDDYILRKHGEEKTTYLHPTLEPILKETNGVVLYQEQVMRIANRLGGLSLAEADALRKAMGKKIVELASHYREQFVNGSVKNGIKSDIANGIYDLLEFFAGYGFNKSHSAAYAMTSYRTAYLKAHYPVEYMAALLTTHRHTTDKIVEYIEECKRMEIEIAPPDVNESESTFTVEGKKIRFGLSAVKNVGEAGVKTIITAREKDGKFRSFFNFCERVDLSIVDKQVMESFIKCGAFDSLGHHRAQLMAIADKTIKIAAQKQSDRKSGQLNLLSTKTGSDSETNYSAYFDINRINPWSQEELLKMEKEATGLYITGHPLVKYEKIIKELSSHNTETLNSLNEEVDVKIGGIVSGVQSSLRRGGNGKSEKRLIFKLRDLTGMIDAIVYLDELKRHKDLIREDRIIFIKGKLSIRQGITAIKVREVAPLAHAYEELARSVTINLSVTGLEERIIQGVKDVLQAHPGNCPVFIYITTPENQKILLKTGTDFIVSPSERFIQDIEEIIGAGHLTFNH